MESILGKMFPVPEDIKEAVTVLMKEEADAAITSRRFAHEANEHNRHLWEIIKRKMPELDGYNLNINMKTMSVTVIGEK